MKPNSMFPIGSRLVMVLVLLSGVLPSVRAQEAPKEEAPILPEETREQRDARMKWWREARFGMFIHWGIYSVPAGTWNGKQIGGIGEWIMNRGKIPVADYAAFAKDFNPIKFDAEQWVKIAQDAGMKYMVITSKHHDGFAMYQSKASPYNIYDATPFKRDPLKELSEACKKNGMRLGFYYSQAQDWHHPGGAAAGGHWDKAQDGDMTEYIKKIAMPQIQEILSNYGPVAVLWFDTPKDMTKERADMILPLLKLQPGIVWNNRLGGGYKGDTETPEQHIPAQGYKDRDWETCMTMNDTWGFKSYDNHWKPVDDLIHKLCDIASKGGNFLLNVGPTSEGQIPEPSVERLAAVGKWMKVNGEAIYATSAGPFKKAPAWGRVTQKPGKLFLLVFDWPKDGSLPVAIRNKVSRACLLASPDKALGVSAGEAGVMIKVPAEAPDPIASAIVLDIEGPVEVVGSQVKAIAPAADGTFTLKAEEAELSGSVKLESKGLESSIGYWTDATSTVEWNIAVKEPGEYKASICWACEPGSDKSQVALDAGEAKLKFTVKATKSWSDFQTAEIGTLKIDKAGTVTVTLKAIKKGKSGVLNLRSLTLKPVGK